MSSPIVLILGAGPNIGKSVASAFAAQGYQVALAARRLSNETSPPGELHIKADLLDTSSVPSIFSTVTSKLGAPSVVVYNAAFFNHDGPDPILSFNEATFQTSLAINTTSAILALAEAIKSFRTLPASASKTFIYTGNILSTTSIPGMLTFGLTKTTASYAIRSAASDPTYTSEGMKFYYADERNEKGEPIGVTPTANAAGKEYVALSERAEQGNWNYVFVSGKGEVKF